MHEGEDAQEDPLAAYFEKSATAVRHSFGRFERELARPTVRYVLESFKEHPIRSTFLANYAVLSVLPILSFLGFSIFVFSSLVFFALSAAILASSAIVLFIGFWLTCTLIFLLLLSIPLTASTLSTYLLLRLVFIARRERFARATISQWAQETKGQFYKAAPPVEEEEKPPVESEGETLIVGSITLDAIASTEKQERAHASEDTVGAVDVVPTTATTEGVKVEGVP
ncbi:hypothetical protein C8Q79DRAFT_1012461 [Trametes meyenii]|nr:hypothetical protein C8Q79DRAFT_1012461 [Trametes meyenii]